MAHNGHHGVESDPAILEQALAGWSIFTSALKWVIILAALILGLMGLFLV